MNIPVGSLTIGGLFVGMAIPTWHIARFAVAHIKKPADILQDAKDLVPLVAGVAYGGLATATTSGLIGFTTGAITWLGNGVGSLAMWGATGGETTLAARSNVAELTGMGNLVLLLITVAILGAWKAIPKKAKPHMRQGIVSGVLLGLSATLGGWFAALVIPTVNSWGAGLVGTIA
ncbi:hypothetical protein [Streptomyces noursei]|uniref:hypothetical protein n=1 Tax=Streptomyces noursei TaxID=1971 RepID=UPI001673DAC9|nr:hypothetical protein [Streptomyces noursei]MCZ1021315.1 hypothetical protein [Streptomyces noursei]GGX55787.1 hypothetical protein GCM10010341_90630 [Streptomyces noursei]